MFLSTRNRVDIQQIPLPRRPDRTTGKDNPRTLGSGEMNLPRLVMRAERVLLAKMYIGMYEEVEDRRARVAKSTKVTGRGRGLKSRRK